VEQHPTVTVTVDRLVGADDGQLHGRVSLQAGGQTQPINPTIEVVDATALEATLRAEVRSTGHSSA
jgi:hypothetical protein